jgi:hypothetical protein
MYPTTIPYQTLIIEGLQTAKSLNNLNLRFIAGLINPDFITERKHEAKCRPILQ